MEINKVLAVHQSEQEARQSECAVGLPTLEAQVKVEETFAKIEEAKARGADARKRRRDSDSTAEPPRLQTAEEKRQSKYREADDRVRRLQARKAERLGEILGGRNFDSLTAYEQEEYRADENSYDLRIREAKEERMKQE